MLSIALTALLAAPTSLPPVTECPARRRGGFQLPLPVAGGRGTGRGAGQSPGRLGGRPMLHPAVGGWREWWNLEADEFVDLRARVRGVATPPAYDGGDDGGVDGTRDRYLRARASEEVVPALVELLRSDPGAALRAEALFALGRIGDVGAVGRGGVPLVDVHLFTDAFDEGNRDLVESAVLALGAYGGRDALGVLASLLADERAGREFLGESSVPDRVRALAAYGVAMAVRDENADVRRYARHRLTTALDGAADARPDVGVACAVALATLVDPERPAEAGALVERMVAAASERGASRELRSHLAAAIGSVASHAPAEQRARATQYLAELVRKRTSAPTEVVRGALVGLGRLAEHGDDAAGEHLRERLAEGDTDTRGVAAVWLARASDANAPAALAESFEEATFTELGWRALACGVASRENTARRADAGEVAARLEAEGSPDAVGALALGAALSGAPGTTETLLERLDRGGDDVLVSDVLLALGLTGDPAALPAVRELMKDSVHRPGRLLAASTASALLGDRDAIEHLLELRQECDCTWSTLNLVQSAGYVGDARALPWLLELAADEEHPELVRTEVVAALGRIAAKGDRPVGRVFAKHAVVGAPTATLFDVVTLD